MLHYKQGDLLTTPDICIAHGCNAQGVTGSGVASAIRKEYPEAYDAYSFIDGYQGLDLGSVIPAHVYMRCYDPRRIVLGRLIYNCITQENYGSDGTLYVDYQAMANCMSSVREHMMIAMKKTQT